MWIQIVVALVQFLGPILVEAFKNWLERRLREKAAKQPVPMNVKFASVEPDSEKRAQIHLLTEVRSDLYFWQVGKKRAVDQCIKAVESGIRVVPRGMLIGEGAV